MAKLVWDQTGERIYETGTDHGVIYPVDSDGAYPTGVAWNGLTGVDENPSGADATKIWADNINYITMYSAEEFGFTIKAYTYPDEFAVCDGSAEPVSGLRMNLQTRKGFGFVYRTLKGNDTDGTDYGYLLHLCYGCKASPSAKSYATVNDSPDAIEFSWEVTTTPVVVNDTYKPTSQIVIDSTKVDANKLTALEAVLFGSVAEDAKLPTPAEVISIISTGSM